MVRIYPCVRTAYKNVEENKMDISTTLSADSPLVQCNLSGEDVFSVWCYRHPTGPRL